MRPYADRDEAGQVLAQLLTAYRDRDDVVVLGLPRGGVPVAARIAAHLGAPLDALIVRKLGLPWQPELAMGAVAGVGDAVEVVRNESVLRQAHLDPREFDAVLERETAELHRRQVIYRGNHASPQVQGRVVIVVDDGLATGSTMRAAAAALRRQAPARVLIAVPIGSPATCTELAAEVDEVVCPWQPRQFYAVGQGYHDFTQVADADVSKLLA